MKRLWKITLFALASSVPSAYASVAHTAFVWFCPQTQFAHSKCVSTLTETILVAKYYREDCTLKRNNITVQHENDLIDNLVGGSYTFKINQNAHLFATAEYCGINQGRFKHFTFINIAGQESDTYCENYNPPGGGGSGGPPGDID